MSTSRAMKEQAGQGTFQKLIEADGTGARSLRAWDNLLLRF